MGVIAPTRRILSPSITSPKFVVRNALRSGFMRVLADGQPDVKLTETTRAVYVTTLDVRTLARGAQSNASELPSVDIQYGYISAPTYQQKVGVTYSRDDVNSAADWNSPLPALYSHGMAQAHFQLMRDAALYGFNPQNGEGILNSSASERESLPADSNGKTTLDDYDAGQAFQYLLGVFNRRLVACNLMGVTGTYNSGGAPVRLVVLAPQRVISKLNSRIVELTSYQRAGAGSASILQSLVEVMHGNNVSVEFAPDDSLIGRGTGGTDAVIITLPELPDVGTIPKFNTNEFGDSVQPNERAMNTMFTDRVVASELSAPWGPEMTRVVSFMRITAGWALRGEGTTILSVPAVASTSGGKTGS